MSRIKKRRGSRAILNNVGRASDFINQEMQADIESSQPDSMASIQVQSQPCDKNLLERAFTQWQLGDWESLSKSTREEIEFHPDRAKLALFVAMGHLQTNKIDEARQFVRLAQDWGCNKRLITRILVSGVYNTLGRAYSIVKNYSYALQYFQTAISIGIPNSDISFITQARINSQRGQLGLFPIEDISKPIVRTIHHFSCTGGTLLAKCLAAQPNVVMLNEVDPFSKLSVDKTRPVFAPKDIISLLHQSGETFDNKFIADIFCEEIEHIINKLAKAQKSLIIREHTHGAYLVGKTVRNTPVIDEVLKKRFNVKSIITVRNPIDSYLSMQKMGWIHFEPPTFDEYCFRYLCFLKDYNGVKIFKYEDLVENSADIMALICRELDIEFNGNFINKFFEYQFSGDSGRSGSVIEPRARRQYSQDFVREVNNSKNFKELGSVLGYEHFLT